jgi:basic membrane protein A
MRLMRQFLFWVLLAAPLNAAAQEILQMPTAMHSPGYRPAILFESDKRPDKGFIDLAERGAYHARSDLHIDITEYHMKENDDRDAIIKKIADEGATHIIAVGFENVVPVLKLAESYPDIRFIVIDGMVPPVYPNVRSIVFRDNEGGFLVGMLAAMKTTTGTIGFVGGMDVPLIRNFALGYEAGAHYVRPDIKILRNMIGTSRDAWSSPEQAMALAEGQIAQGADVIFGCAGGSTLGVLKAAHDKGKLAIGIDENQNGIYPGFVLTSLLKRVDKAIYDALRDGAENHWESGIRYMGINEGALDYAVDNYNRRLITREMVEKVENAKDLIMRGTLKVPQYTPN